MRKQGTGFGLLTAALLTLVGCHAEPFVRPPKPVEELRDPPVEDARFSQPPNYPKGVLNEDKIRKPEKDIATPGGLPRGSQGRPGGPGGGY